jgi:hypothetical protein
VGSTTYDLPPGPYAVTQSVVDGATVQEYEVAAPAYTLTNNAFVCRHG